MMQKIGELTGDFESFEEMPLVEQDEDLWKPSPQDIDNFLTEMGSPSFGDLKTDHLESLEEKQKLENAIGKAKSFLSEIKEGRGGVSMIMLASAVDGDMERTGYGCGKTTLARIIHHGFSYANYAAGHPKSLQILPRGKFCESRQIMSLFESDKYDPRHTFRSFRDLVTIDDLGREGALKWEKRDPDSQLAEKQARYYNVINHCYQNGVSMLITSNLSSREMAAFLGGASWSRLLQMVPKRYRVNMTGIRDMRPLLADTEW